VDRETALSYGANVESVKMTWHLLSSRLGTPSASVLLPDHRSTQREGQQRLKPISMTPIGG
jgi:hypothetical protein